MTQVHGIFLSARAEGDLGTEADGVVDRVTLGCLLLGETLCEQRVVAMSPKQDRDKWIFLVIFSFLELFCETSPSSKHDRQKKHQIVSFQRNARKTVAIW